MNNEDNIGRDRDYKQFYFHGDCLVSIDINEFIQALNEGKTVNIERERVEPTDRKFLS